jgi:hypothetical protein
MNMMHAIHGIHAVCSLHARCFVSEVFKHAALRSPNGYTDRRGLVGSGRSDQILAPAAARGKIFFAGRGAGSSSARGREPRTAVDMVRTDLN